MKATRLNARAWMGMAVVLSAAGMTMACGCGGAEYDSRLKAAELKFLSDESEALTEQNQGLLENRPRPRPQASGGLGGGAGAAANDGAATDEGAGDQAEAPADDATEGATP